MPDMRRRAPEPPAGPPQVQFKPGMADELLQELAPLLAEEGIDIGSGDVPGLETLQQAMNRAVERHNMARFTPAGDARERAAVLMRLAAEAISDGDTRLAASVIGQAQPESPDGSAATVGGCTGVALGLLSQWLSGQDPDAPAGLAKVDAALDSGLLDSGLAAMPRANPTPRGATVATFEGHCSSYAGRAPRCGTVFS